jgi:outer membrane protein assembly factor BamB
VVGGSNKIVIAHNTATGAVLWRKEMPDLVQSLRIHGGVVVVPVDNSNTVVLDVTTGHQLHALPSAGELVMSVCVFDGLAIE